MGLCEILGKFSNNIPFHEFFEHNSLKVMHFVVNETQKFSIEGILLANNLGPEFVKLNELIISLKTNFEKFTKTEINNNEKINFYDSPPNRFWLDKPKEDRKNYIIEEINNFISKNTLP